MLVMEASALPCKALGCMSHADEAQDLVRPCVHVCAWSVRRRRHLSVCEMRMPYTDTSCVRARMPVLDDVCGMAGFVACTVGLRF